MKTKNTNDNSACQIKFNYPVTGLVKPKPIISYSKKGPYGDFGNEDKLIAYLETLDDGSLKRLSYLYNAMTKRRGGWEFTDALYKDQPQTELDKYIYNLKLCRAVWNRKNVVREQLLKTMREYIETGGLSVENPMQIIDLGSGPSDYTIEAFSNYKASDNGSGLPAKAACIDIDQSALKRGEELAINAGVNGNIEFKRYRIETILKEGGINDANMILAIGVICPYSDDVVMELFTRSMDALKSGGAFYTCAVRHHPLEKVLNRAGWILNPREPEYLERMMKEAGYETEIYLDAEEFFVMALGRKSL